MTTNPFKTGDRVQFSPEAYDANVATWVDRRPGSQYGTVTSTRGPLSVVVHRDGYKASSRYHIVFWEHVPRSKRRP